MKIKGSHRFKITFWRTKATRRQTRKLLISEEAERKAREIISSFETADAAEVSEDAEGGEHEDDGEDEEDEGAEV